MAEDKKTVLYTAISLDTSSGKLECLLNYFMLGNLVSLRREYLASRRSLQVSSRSADE